ncbi:MAG: adenylate/guanylate cyclase domain-containing protein [Methylococcales bacterium]|nr:adenylate/guanylate cyclase domain-containing protein [Methylococcales bacterium]
MNHANETNNIAVSSAEILSIQSYIQSKNTAVLTIMFTDIKGFTDLTEQKGEQYATQFRTHHDEILTQVIEQDGAGLIIKFIGDAVMAVFSEPSVAVERALKIQQRLDDFNAAQQEFEPINVRIGLHTGQVSIGNTLQADVFGRHVNRAARIESLADGGQIYLSYTVFDSAKGWLANHKNIQWQNHGRYYLKGIDEAIEIYEVLAREHAIPKAPLQGNKQRSFPKLLTSVILVLVTVALTAAVFYLQKAEVYFVRFYPEAMYLDNAQPIALAGEKIDQSRKVITDIKRGKHIVHYEVTHSYRYYADLDIQRGINNIELKFKELRLPSVQRYVSSLVKENKVQEQQTFSYALYDNKGDKIPFNVDINLQLSS